MNNNFQQALQELLDAEAKKMIFASSPELRGENSDIEANLKGHTIMFYEPAVKKLKKNPFFKAAKDAGIDMAEFKKMAMSSIDKASAELRKKLDKVFDYAIKGSNS